MPADSQAQRTQIARIAANTSWALTPDRSARTAPARAALMRKFERAVDPENALLPAERARRAESARRAHFQRLALKSAAARQARASAAQASALSRRTRGVSE